MNERIKELSEQAGIVFWEMSGDVDWRQANKETLEKFAELIVEECIKLNGKELAMAGHSRMVDVYCEHFGIEL